jgi:hypothetical protein
MQPVNRIVAFESCGMNIRVLQDTADPHRFKLVGNYCHDRWCTPCATERARTIARNVLELAGTTRLRFMTLTLKAKPVSLDARVGELRAYFSRLKRTALWKRSVKAGIACLEVKRYKTVDGWHCHYHVLFHGKYIERLALARTWLTITTDSDIVDIRLARDRKNAAHYITRYVSKPLDMDCARNDDLLDEAVRALKGVRLMDTFGSWRGHPLTQSDDNAEWVDVGTLDGLLLAAYHGNAYATQLISDLRRTGMTEALAAASHYVPPIAPRPPPAIPTTPSLFGDQGYVCRGCGF